MDPVHTAPSLGASKRPVPANQLPLQQPILAVRVIRGQHARESRRGAFEPFFSSSPRRHNHVAADDPTS
ncbi:unnamed protein product [Alopecurus aequalis]